jgi:hypothetical protein
VICKFFGPRFGWDRDRAARAAYREFDAMQGLRSYDLVGSPHHVVRPLGVDVDLNSVLAIEFYPGEQFSHAIKALHSPPQRQPSLLASESAGVFSCHST